MKYLALLLVMATSTATAGLPSPGEVGAIDDPRYCGEPERTKAGRLSAHKLF